MNKEIRDKRYNEYIMDLQNKLIIRKRISEKGPYIEGTY